MSTLTITQANHRGISGLASAAEAGDEISLSRHGHIVATILSAREAEQLRQDRETLRDAALVMTRMATDSGARTDLDDAMAMFGIDRDELQAEIDAGLHTL